MNLTEIRVRNFRSIETEQHLLIPGRITLVGPNSSGKTNLLRAIQVLFTGYSNSYGYNRDVDLTFDVGRLRTSITATFDGNPDEETDIYREIDELHTLQNTTRHGTEISLTLYFTETNTPVYNFFPNIKRPKGAQGTQYSRTHRGLVEHLLESFSLHYVPSAKSVDQIYHELLTPFLRQKVSKVIEPYLTQIEESLTEVASALNTELSSAQLPDIRASFSLPNQSIEKLVSGFDFMISDPQLTPVHDKGMGIQTTALLAAFRWITQQELQKGLTVLWLLEEPESYLHPNLASNCNTILENLANDAIVVKTTHSMAFVPQDPKFVTGTQLNAKNRTEIIIYKTFSEAVTSIRDALGIRFSDFYNLAQYNIFVEGASDRELFQLVLEALPEQDYPFTYVREAKFEDFGGVKHLSGFLRATYQFISQEYACVTVFDGDDAGEKERRDLQQYFGQKTIPFQPNRHYISVRSGFAIEGLFPDEWIKKIYDEHSSWFLHYSVDALGQLEPFKIKDNFKSKVQNQLITFTTTEVDIKWAEKFIAVFSVINTALESLSKSLDAV